MIVVVSYTNIWLYIMFKVGENILVLQVFLIVVKLNYF